MKKSMLLLGGIAGATAFVTPAFAQVSGTAGATYNLLSDEISDYTQIIGTAGLAVPISGNITVLVDGTVGSADDEAGTSYDFNGITGHALFRLQGMTFGAFVSAENTTYESGFELATTVVGVEWAGFVGNSTLALSAAIGEDDFFPDSSTTFGAEYRYFVSDNFRVEVGGAVRSYEFNDFWQAGIGAEYRFGRSPFSIAGGVGANNNYGLETTFVTATLRFDFGNDSLKSRDRTGNTFGATAGFARPPTPPP